MSIVVKMVTVQNQLYVLTSEGKLFRERMMHPVGWEEIKGPVEDLGTYLTITDFSVDVQNGEFGDYAPPFINVIVTGGDLWEQGQHQPWTKMLPVP